MKRSCSQGWAAVLCMMFPLCLRSAGVEECRTAAVYFGGSAVSIPAYANGVLDWSKSGELVFHFGERSESWPLTSVMTFTMERPANRALWQKAATLGILALPPFNARGERELTIHYRDSQGQSGTVVFGVEGGQASRLAEVLEQQTGQKLTFTERSREREQVRKSAVRPASNPHVMYDGSWWGDQFWKTSRNQNKWQDRGAPPQVIDNAPGGNGTREP